MVILANRGTTYDFPVGNSRDVTDYVTNISPSDTPFFSMIGDTKGVARTKENVQDADTAANENNALVEGDEFTNDALVDRTLEVNTMQIFRKVIDISETQEVVIKYGGIKSELKYQIDKAYREIATDVEKAMIVGTSATGTTAVARKLSGLLEKIVTNTSTADATGTTWTGTAEANLAAYEELLNDMFQQAYDTGETLDTVLVGGAQKRRISKLSQKVTRNVDAEKKTQILSINMYDGDFGSVNIILDRYVPDANIIGVKLEYFKTAYLRRFKMFKLAKTSDATRMAIVGELTLDARTEKAGAKITAA